MADEQMDIGKFDLALLAERIAAAVVARHNDFIPWSDEGMPGQLDQEKLADVVEEEIMKGFVLPS